MKSHRLVQKGGPSDAEWVLAWDDATLTLTAPDGQRVLQATPTAAHRLVELYELYAEGNVSFATPYGSLEFKKPSATVAAVRELVESGMAGDPEFCAELRRQSLRTITRGLVMFVVCAGPFGLYCWYASWAPEPPAGHWIRRFGWAIHGVLLVLMGVGLAALFAAYFGLRQWLRVKRIQRLTAEAQRLAGRTRRST
jgi:hypothetical protein